jgi:hypothetical protein
MGMMFQVRLWLTSLFALLLTSLAHFAFAHPGSGIVIAENGDVYFIDTGSGVYKIGADGMTPVEGASAYHWMAIDHTGGWRNAALPYYPQGQFEPAGETSTLLLSSDVPIAISGGDLVYPQPRIDRRLEINRWSLTGEKTVFAVLPAETEDGPLQWLSGLAAGSGRSLYYTENSSVRRVNDDGSLTTIATEISVPDCVQPPGYEVDLIPGLRGLDIHPDGRVFVAATGCSALLSITPDGAVSVILRTEAPWSPTAVAVSGDALYVLEYLHKETDDRREWTPRVRMLSPDGKHEIIATVAR